MPSLLPTSTSQSDPAYELSPRGKTLLQERLAVYALTVTGIAAGYWPSFYAVWSNEPGVSRSAVLDHILSRWTLALLLLHGALWLACRGQRCPRAGCRGWTC